MTCYVSSVALNPMHSLTSGRYRGITIFVPCISKPTRRHSGVQTTFYIRVHTFVVYCKEVCVYDSGNLAARRSSQRSKTLPTRVWQPPHSSVYRRSIVLLVIPTLIRPTRPLWDHSPAVPIVYRNVLYSDLTWLGISIVSLHCRNTQNYICFAYCGMYSPLFHVVWLAYC